MINLIKREIKESIDLKLKVLNNSEIINQLSFLAEKCTNSLKHGGKIIFCGNGGSFADSQHLTAEFISKLRIDRLPIAAITLGTNNSNLTALGNDYGFNLIFKREIEALGKKEDILKAIHYLEMILERDYKDK